MLLDFRVFATPQANKGQQLSESCTQLHKPGFALQDNTQVRKEMVIRYSLMPA